MKAIFLALKDGDYEIPGMDWKTFVFEDLQVSRKAIERELGRPADYLAWPYGTGSSEIDSLAVAAGFKGICSLEDGAAQLLDTETHSPLPDGLADSVGDTGARIVAAGSPLGPSTGASRVVMAWNLYEIPRLTITARTPLRGFRQMLAD